MLYAVNNGCPPTYEMLTECVKRGRVDGMMGLMKPDRPVNFDGDTIGEAIEYSKKNGDLEPFKVLVRFLLEHGKPTVSYNKKGSGDDHKVVLHRCSDLDWVYRWASCLQSLECQGAV